MIGAVLGPQTGERGGDGKGFQGLSAGLLTYNTSQDPHSYLVRASARSFAALKSYDTKSFRQ